MGTDLLNLHRTCYGMDVGTVFSQDGWIAYVANESADIYSMNKM